MNRRVLLAIASLASLLALGNAHAAKVSVLIDFDPNSAAQTVVV